jgi:hypothetical protein
METQDISKAARLLQKNWDLVPPPQLDWEGLRLALKQQLHHMLVADFERLVQTMYRLDVNEGKFLLALELITVEERAEALAHIVMERELQRLATWQKYSST